MGALMLSRCEAETDGAVGFFLKGGVLLGHKRL